MGMAHRRGNGTRATAFALLLAALGGGAGCGNSGGATGNDGGASSDVGDLDGATNDVGPVGDGATGDGGVDSGMAVDSGNPTDVVGDVGTGDGGTGDGGTGDGGVGDGGAGDGGATGRGRAGSSLVSAGTLMRSARFQMISTLGGRSVQQTYLQSPNYRLRGGLVGVIGAR